jgi:exopolysaccharide production protein ExoZ
MAFMTVTQPEDRATTSVSGRGKLFHLQALRGLAASLVVLSHCAETLAQRGLIPEAYGDRLGISGYFGVATFFIISGFIICKTSTGAFGDPRGVMAFVLKRLIRIFPVYWIATAAFYVLSPHRATYTAADVLCSVLLIPHEIGSSGDMHPLIGQGWTLQYEMLFYLIFTLGLLLTRRTGILLILVALIGVVAAGEAVMPLSDSAEPMTLVQYWTRPILLLFPVCIGFALLEARLPRSLAVPRPFILMLGVLGLWFAYSLIFPLAAKEQIQFPVVAAIWALGAVWVFVSIFGRSRGGWTEWLAERFGDASYSVYLFHTFILSALLRLKVQNHSPVLFVAAALVGSNVFGLAMYRLVETPILRTFRGMLPTSRPGSSVPRRPPAAPR